VNALNDSHEADYVPFDDFRAGLPAGRFRVIVNPKLARRYVSQRLMLMVLLLPVIGIGIALALRGAVWGGGLLVLAGIAVNRLLMWQAPQMLLHMAQRDASVYDHATRNGLLEVRRVE